MIVALRAFSNEEHQEDDRADQRDQADQQPPAAAVGIVQPADANRDRGGSEAPAGRGTEPDHHGPIICDRPRIKSIAMAMISPMMTKQFEPPIFRARGAASYVGIFLDRALRPFNR